MLLRAVAVLLPSAALVLLLSMPAAADDETAVLFRTYCLTCHGESGKGDGPAGKALTPPPRDFSDTAYMSTRTDAQIKAIIKDGGMAVGMSPIMPAWGPVLGDEGVEKMARYVRAFSRKDEAVDVPTADAAGGGPVTVADDQSDATETEPDQPSEPTEDRKPPEDPKPEDAEPEDRPGKGEAPAGKQEG